jgi:hypothetical protein
MCPNHLKLLLEAVLLIYEKFYPDGVEMLLFACFAPSDFL